MMLWIIIGVLFVVSILWTLLALKKEISKPHEIEKTERELKKEKVLFRQP